MVPEANIKGMVLAAGFGTRLRPLTDRLPKPLVPFAGSHPLELALWRLKQAGIEQVAVNGHHLAPQIEKFVASNPFDQDLYFSREDEILGTGGVYNPLRHWLGDSDLLVYNGDIITDMDLRALVATHRKTGAFATMAMLPDVIPGENGFFCNGQGQLVAFGKDGPPDTSHRNFACAQIMSRRMIDSLPESGAFGIIEEGYLPALKKGEPLFSWLHQGFWHDLRTPRFYAEAVWDFLKRDPATDSVGVGDIRRQKRLKNLFVASGETLDLPFKATGPVLLDESCQVDSGVVLGPNTVLEPGCSIGPGVRLDHVLTLVGTEVPKGSYAHCILGPDGLKIDV